MGLFTGPHLSSFIPLSRVIHQHGPIVPLVSCNRSLHLLNLGKFYSTLWPLRCLREKSQKSKSTPTCETKSDTVEWCFPRWNAHLGLSLWKVQTRPTRVSTIALFSPAAHFPLNAVARPCGRQYLSQRSLC